NYLPRQPPMLGMNPYLARMRAGDHETSHPRAPSKPSKPSFEGFEGDRSRCFPQSGLIRTGAGDTPYGAQSLALGWTARDLFGLHTPPENPHLSYQRLSPYDQTGLIWLVEGCEVLAITPNTATIHRPSGSITTYRKDKTPASRALGDGDLAQSLDPNSD